MEKVLIVGIQHPSIENKITEDYVEVLNIEDKASSISILANYVEPILKVYLNEIQRNDVLNNLGQYRHGYKIICTDNEVQTSCTIYKGEEIPAGWIYSSYVQNECKLFSFYTLKFHGYVTAKNFMNRNKQKKIDNYVDELKEKFARIPCDETHINPKEVIK
jgi:hypothetical protein